MCIPHFLVRDLKGRAAFVAGSQCIRMEIPTLADTKVRHAMQRCKSMSTGLSN